MAFESLYKKINLMRIKSKQFHCLMGDRSLRLRRPRIYWFNRHKEGLPLGCGVEPLSRAFEYIVNFLMG